MKSKGMWKKVIALVLAAVFLLNLPTDVRAASASKAAEGVKSAVSSYPFSASDAVSSRRRVFGVSVSDLKSYKAYQKISGTRNSKCEYVLFVGKAKSKAKAKSCLKGLVNFVRSEYQNMQNYLSKTGKSRFKQAKYGRKGKWIYVAALTSGTDNAKAISAIKRNI